MQFQKIEGLIAATFSPFKPNGELNLTIIPSYASLLKENGIKGAFINGTTGEGASLTFQEKKELIASWSEFNSTDFKVIAMVSGTSQKEGIELAKYAQEKGIYGISVNAPFYVKPNSVQQLVDFISPIAESAPDLPFYFYHIPVLTQVHLPMISLLEIAGSSIPNFAGIKYTHTDLMEFNQCLRYQNGEFDILWGWDEMLLAGLSMGAKGGVGSTYNYAAPLYHELIESFEKGELDQAKKIQEISIDIIALYSKYGGGAAGKVILKIIGLDCGDFRPPGRILSASERDDLLSELQNQKFFNHSMKSNSISGLEKGMV